MPSHPDDDVARGSGGSGSRTLLLTAGLALAVVATLAAFLTDDPRYLRLSVVAAAWAFVAAAFAATRRRGEQQAATARAAELHRTYERELDLEAAARREFELELENDLRAETEQVVRREVSALRGDIAALARVREEMARVARYADDLAGLSALRSEVAALSGLRSDVAALSSLRADLGQLAELRADVARLRQELTEQLNGEMLVERIVMRTQATWMPSDGAPASPAPGPGGLSATPPVAVPSWTDERPELPGGWPGIPLDDPRPTREYERLHAERPAEPRTASFSYLPPPPEPAPSPVEWLADRSLLDPGDLGPAARSRHAAAEPALYDEPVRYDEPRAAEPPLRPVPYRRRRSDDTDELGGADPVDDVTAERPIVPPDRPPLPSYGQPSYGQPSYGQPSYGQPSYGEPSYGEPSYGEPAPEPAPQTDGHARLAEILAENGARPSGRRQHRYREDDEPDDVLSRVLRKN